MYQADISLVNNQNAVYSLYGIENWQCVKNKNIIFCLLRGSFICKIRIQNFA